jgi:hypothetical protein
MIILEKLHNASVVLQHPKVAPVSLEYIISCSSLKSSIKIVSLFCPDLAS